MLGQSTQFSSWLCSVYLSTKDLEQEDVKKNGETFGNVWDFENVFAINGILHPFAKQNWVLGEM